MSQLRLLVMSCSLTALASGCAPLVATPTPTTDAPARVIAIANDYLAVWRETFPEVNTTNGIPGRRRKIAGWRNSAASTRAHWWVAPSG